jgi:hypothetical protein
MRFVEAVDYGDAPTFFATGVAAINVVAAGVVEIVLFRRVCLQSGETENRVVSRTIWARDEWTDASLVTAQAIAAMQNGTLPEPAAKPGIATSH